MYEVLWEKKAFKQLMAIRHDYRKPITEALARLHNWPNRLLKNTRLLRCAHHSSLRRTTKYASFVMISHALRSDIFEQPVY